MIKKIIKKVLLKLSKTEDISIENIKSIDLSTYVNEGYGGKHISYFPPSKFFKLFLDGEKEKAINDFINWYDCQFKKYFNVPKNKGGMKNGSLYRLIEERHKDNNIYLKEDLSNLKEDIYKEAVRERVKQRIDLFEDIKDKGYKQNDDIIYGVKRNGYIYLKGGHHRCAACCVLGYKTVPVKLKK
jgi:hypothetical protein